MGDFKGNCSLCDECGNISVFQANSLSENIVLKLYEFICITIIVIGLHLFNIVMCSEFKLKELKISNVKEESKKIIYVVYISLLILTLPFCAMLLGIALLYKVVCSVVIKRKDKRFVKFLDSFDVFYCLEDKTTTDMQGVIQSSTIEIAVNKIKDKLRNVFTNNGTDKMFYRKNEEYGFYYWRRYSFIDLAQYVQIVEVPETSDKNKRHICERNVKADIDIYKDEGLFKVFIINNPHGDMGNDEYKIILKFHHSVKDAAQLEFVARLVKDADDCRVTIDFGQEPQDFNSPDALMDMITKLCGILTQSFDNHNSGKENLHNNPFTRIKALEWTKSDENLLSKVNDVRNNVFDLFR